MSPRQLKAGFFALEGLNSFATTYFFFYFFFFMAKVHGFGDRENLAAAALNGLIYAVGVWQGGRLGARLGSFKALAWGFSIMAAALGIGTMVASAGAHIGVMVVCTCGMCLTWPNLEALASEKETPAGLQRMVGIYNVVWAGMGCLAFFAGGVMLEAWGLRSIFWVPTSLLLLQLILLAWLVRESRRPAASVAPCLARPMERPALNPRPIARAKAFLRMAWLANPFAYVAVNTVVAVVPSVARDLGLTPAGAGFFCSVWLFARLATFVWLWLWQGWHYRFRWLLSAYLLLILGFATILLGPRLGWIVVGQVVFGVGIGLIYYSSLYYSMDVGEAKSEHGGFHEAAIGAGLFGGPAVGAAALHLFPGQAGAGVAAVGILLVLGLMGVLVVRGRSPR